MLASYWNGLATSGGTEVTTEGNNFGSSVTNSTGGLDVSPNDTGNFLGKNAEFERKGDKNSTRCLQYFV